MAEADNEAWRWLEQNSDPGLGDGFLRSVDNVAISGIHYAALQGSDLWPFGSKKCYILSPYDIAAPAGAEIILCGEKDPAGAVEALRESVGGDIWLAGDTRTVARFLGAGLIDEVVLNILPVTLGRGTAFFGQSDRVAYWKLSEHQIFEGGIIQARYTAQR